MPKVILEFDYYEDREEYKSMMNANHAIKMIVDIKNIIKYANDGGGYDDVESLIHEIEEVVFEPGEFAL